MVYQLLPDVYVKVADVDIAELSRVDEGLCDEIGKKGDHLAFRNDRGDDVGTSYFKHRGYFQGFFCKLLVKHTAVALTVFGENKRLVYYVVDAYILHFCVF